MKTSFFLTLISLAVFTQAIPTPIIVDGVTVPQGQASGAGALAGQGSLSGRSRFNRRDIQSQNTGATPDPHFNLGGAGNLAGQGSISGRDIYPREGNGDPCGDDSCNPGDDTRRRDVQSQNAATTPDPHFNLSGAGALAGQGSISGRDRIYRRGGGDPCGDDSCNGDDKSGDPCGDDSCNPGDTARRRRGEYTGTGYESKGLVL